MIGNCNHLKLLLMKNFTLLLVAILSLSMAYAQQPQLPVIGDKQPTTAMPYKISPNGMIVFTNPIDKSTSERSDAQSRTLIALYDSIFTWNLYDVTWNADTKTDSMIYDANNNLTNEVLQYWTGSAWVDSSKTTYAYNSAHLDTSYINQIWVGNAWVNNFHESWTYNSGNSITRQTEQTGSGATWTNYAQWLYTYNSNNLETSEIFQTGSGSSWTPAIKDTFTYNSNNLEATDLNQDWSGTAWVNNDLATFTYNSNNDRTNILSDTWVSNAWDTGGQVINTYNSENELTNSLQQGWGGSSGWENEFQTTDFTYNAFKNLTNYATQSYISNAWVYYFQNSWAYNSKDLDTLSSNQSWDGSGWETTAQSTYHYDANNIKVSEVDIAHGSIDSSHWYFTKTAQSGINIPGDLGTIQLYPNPSSNFIHAVIQLKQTSDLQLRLVNILGQIVWSTDVGNVSSYQNNISVANLPDGVYLLEMITGGGTESREVVTR